MAESKKVPKADREVGSETGYGDLSVQDSSKACGTGRPHGSTLWVSLQVW